MSDDKDKQIEIAERLQTKLLEDFEKLVDNGALTAADRATLVRLLMNNGWSLDPDKLPGTLRDKLTKHIPADKFDEDDSELPVN